MRKILLTAALICILCLMCACGNEQQAQLASAENVFKSVTYNLPTDASPITGLLEMGDRIGIAYHDGYNPELDFDTVLLTLDKNCENPETTVIPRQRETAAIRDYIPTPDGGCIILDVDYGGDVRHMLYCMDADFNVNLTVDVKSEAGLDEVNRMAVAENGNIYLATDNTAAVLDSNGKLLYTVSFSGWVESLKALSDGRVALSYFNQGNGTTKQQYFNDNEKSLGDTVAIPKKLNASTYEAYAGDGTYEMYLTNDIGIYGYNSSTAETVELCNWFNSDVVPNEVNEILVYSPDEFAVYGNDSSEIFSSYISVMRRVPEDEVTQKYLITLQTDHTSLEIQRAVVLFNRQSDKYRVVVKDYSQYNTSDDAFVSLSQLDKEVVSGEYIPDIFTISDEAYFYKYAELGMFCDLYEFLDSDEAFGRDALVPAVMKPMETDGKLYRLARGFNLQMMIAAPDFEIKRDDWTYAKMMEFAESCGEYPMFARYFRSSLLQYFFNYDMSSFIKNTKCNFSNDEMIKLVELIGSYGSYTTADLDAEAREALEEELKERFENGQAVAITDLSDRRTILTYSLLFDGKIPTVIGMPSENGGYIQVSPNDSYAISSKSPVKDGAWEFVKFILEKDYVVHNSAEIYMRYGYSSTRENFNRELDEDSKLIYYYNKSQFYPKFESLADSINVNITDEYNVDRLDLDRYEIVEYTSEHRAAIEAIVESAATPRVYYSEAYDIIAEELDYYFEGAKTAKEAAALIDNRVSIYISEKN